MISTCPNCGSQVYGDLSIHDRSCDGGNSGALLDPFNGNVDPHNGNASLNNCIVSVDTKENRETLKSIFPDCTDERIQETLQISSDLENAVTSILKEGSPPKYGLSEVRQVVEGFKGKSINVMLEERPFFFKVRRSNLWRDGIGFYKSSMGDLKRLKAEFRVSFEGEDGVDCGALRAEFFSKFFEYALKELFEFVEGKEWQHVPKRSGGNVQIFKVLGTAIAHSVLHDGPFFPFLAPWVVDILCSKTSGQISVADIPVTSATGCTINFIKSLDSCSSNKMISDLFDSADGPAFEQIVGLSDWDQNEEITIKNKEILIHMLVFEELV